ncbi:3'-5' exoribonuclease YhaM family protein [Bacillus sp. AK128]
MNTKNCLLDIVIGDTFEGPCLIKEATLSKTKKNEPFLNVSIAKKQKVVIGKVWKDGFRELSEVQVMDIFRPGSLLFVKGEISEYNSQPQITISTYRMLKEGEGDVRDFIECAPETSESMEQQIREYIQAIDIPILHQISSELFEENRKHFMVQVAATKMHHNFIGGLAYHTLSLLRIAESIANQYEEIVNRSKLYAALLLHDLGKIVEMTRGTAPEYSLVGQFLGHIQIVNQMIDRKLVVIRKQREVSVEEITLVYELMNCISAHHGPLSNGWGSTAEAMTLEAYLCHMIDNIDAKINMISKELVNMEVGDVSKIYGLGKIYKSPF